MVRYFTAIAALMLMAPAFATPQPMLPEGVYSYQNRFYLSGTPTSNMAQSLQEVGVRAMIDLRETAEITDSIGSTAKQYGMAYFSSPVSKTGPLQPGQFAAVDRWIRENGIQKPWIFCSSGNRAAAWLAIHLATVESATPETALAAARAHGLTSEQWAEKVRSYLKTKRN